MAVHRVGELELSEDVSFASKEWIAQRIAWVLMIALVAASLAGLFGRGPLASATAGSAGGAMWIEYERFDRFHFPTEIVVNLEPSEAGAPVEIWLSNDFLADIDLERVVPQPDEERMEADRIVFSFSVHQVETSGSVTIAFQHDAVGLTRLEAGLIGGPAREAWILVYP